VKNISTLFLMSSIAVGIISAGCATANNKETAAPYMTRHDQVEINGNGIYQSLGRAKVDGGYRDDIYRVWGSSIVKGDDGKFHMYVSRWPKNIKFHPGWMAASEIAHCVTHNLSLPPFLPATYNRISFTKQNKNQT
jgi:hypothetical protein